MEGVTEAEQAAMARAWAEHRYNIVHWPVQPQGGHFAPFEQSELLTDDLRAFARLFR